MSRYVFRSLTLAVAISGVAHAQLPADAVMLDKVKIPEKQKSVDLCPVYLVAADENLPSWEYNGVKYRGSKPDAQEKFMKDPDTYAKAAARQRYINNFMLAMSSVWCPVTDEVTPGGMTQWKKLGYTFESCCAFCDENVSDDDFPEAVKKLKAAPKRALS